MFSKKNYETEKFESSPPELTSYSICNGRELYFIDKCVVSRIFLSRSVSNCQNVGLKLAFLGFNGQLILS